MKAETENDRPVLGKTENDRPVLGKTENDRPVLGKTENDRLVLNKPFGLEEGTATSFGGERLKRATCSSKPLWNRGLLAFALRRGSRRKCVRGTDSPPFRSGGFPSSQAINTTPQTRSASLRR